MTKEEESLGNWPRRLLHVPSLTSLEWQPGNIYGDCKEPEYCAISYTWGRWRLRGDRVNEVSPLAVKGTPWSIPSIDPDHFTVDQIHEVIKKSTTFDTPGEPSTSHGSVEFVWIDIACIDQRWGEPRGAAEVGRQAAIFGQASKVYIWLSTQTISDLERVVDELFNSMGTATSTLLTQHIGPALECLSDIMKDPWFSSLWTLQEAFLRTPDAEILSSEGCLMQTPRGHETDARPRPGLTFLIFRATGLQDACDHVVSQNSAAENWGPDVLTTSQQLTELVDQKGLRALNSRHPMAVYHAATNRTASRDSDRVYGIQQIFGLRVGSSSPLVSEHRSYARAELEEQLGEKLLTKEPVLSQLHIYSKPVDTVGNGWRLNGSSIVPRNSFLMRWLKPEHGGDGNICEPMCTFVTRRKSGTLWGHFEGVTCSFKHVEAWCQRLDCDPKKMVPHGSTVLHIFLDNVPELQECPQVRNCPSDPSRESYGMRLGSEMKAFRKWLARRYKSKLVVLLLSRRQEDDLTPYKRLGLLILRRSSFASREKCWQRIGICQWCYTWPGLHTESNLRGEGRMWKRTSGCFG